MPIVQLPIGVNLSVLSGETYSIPCTWVSAAAGVAIQYGPSEAGPFASHTLGSPIKCGFIKPSANTSIKLTRVNTYKKNSPSYLSPYTRQIMADGASYYWRLGESSGLIAVDSVGGANGTISGGVTLGAAGAISDGNTAMTFNGTTGKVVTAANVSIPLDATIEAWVKFPSGLTQRPIVSSRPSTSGLTGLYVGSTTDRLFLYSAGTGVENGTAIIADNQWHHVVVTTAQGSTIFYVDGVLDRSILETVTVAVSCPISIGWDAPSPATQFWQGALDEVAIYPRALTAPEIAAHYSLRLRS